MNKFDVSVLLVGLGWLVFMLVSNPVGWVVLFMWYNWIWG